MQLVNILNGNGNIISKVKLESSATAPVAGDYIGGLAGAMYHNSTSGAAMFFNGTEWIPVAKIVGVTGQTTVTYTGNPVSAIVGLDPAVVGSFLPLSGGTMTGILYNTSGISATSVSAVNFYGKLTGATVSATSLTATTISATTITATTITGTATSALSADQATHLTTGRTFSIAGADVSATGVSFDGTGNVTLVGDLKPTGVVSGSYGTNVYIPNFIVDSKGRITSATQQALSISGANGGTVTSVGVSSTTLAVTLSPVTVSGTISVGLSAIHAGGGGATKVTYDQYGRVTSSGFITSADVVPVITSLYVPISGGTMTGQLNAPSITVTGTGITINNDGQGVTFFGGASIYKMNGGGIRIKRHSGEVDPMVESNASSATAWTIWHAGNLSGTQTGHNHYSQFTGTSGINYVSATGTFGLTSVTATPITATKIVTDVYGRVVSGGSLISSDIPALSGQYLGVGLSAQANGVASLDSSGKVPTTQLPPSVFGQVHYAGTWNATSGSTMPSAASVSGAYYITSVSGSTTPTGGFSPQTITEIAQVSAFGLPWFNVGDWLVSNGTTWDKVDNTDAIFAWNGRVGIVTPLSGDYTATQVNSTATGSVTATNVQAAIAQLATLDSAKVPLSGGTMTGILNNNVGISAANLSAVNIYDSTFTGSKALVSVGKVISESTITSTELGYLSGTSANIQVQLNGKMNGVFNNGDDYSVPVYTSAGGFVNSSSYIVGATKEKLVMSDKTQVVTDDYHSPGIGVQIGMQPGTSGANSTGFFFTMDTSGSTKLFNGKWMGSQWNNYWNMTSAGVMQLPQMAGTSGIIAVTSAGNFIKYTLTSADLPNMSGIYMPVSGGDFTGKITAPSADIGNLSARGGITLTDMYHNDTFIGYKTTGWPLYIRVNGIDAIQIDNLGGVTFNKQVDFLAGSTTNFYSSATFNNPTVFNNTITTKDINAGSFNVSAYSVFAQYGVFASYISATTITAPTLNVTTITSNSVSANTITAVSFYEGGQLLSARYLPLSGGMMSGYIGFNGTGTSGIGLGISGSMAGSDQWRIAGGSVTNSDDGYLEIATADNGNEPIYFRQYTSATMTSAFLARTLTLLDATGNTILPGTLKASATPSAGGTYSGTLKIDTTGLIYKDTTIVDHKRWSGSQVIGVGTQTFSATHNLGVTSAAVRCFITATGEPVMLEPNYATSTSTVMVFTTNSSVSLTSTIVIEI